MSKARDMYIACFGMNRWDRLRQKIYSIQDKKSGVHADICGNAEFKNKYEGQRCFIMGNGPSAKRIDPELLKDEVLFTVNQFANTEIFQQLRPTFHIWSDDRFFQLDENDPGDMEILRTMRAVDRPDCHPTVFYKMIGKDMVEKFGLKNDLDLRFYADDLQFCGDFDCELDLTKRLPWFPTVVQYGIAMAIYMGFKEIYLLGCECTGFINLAKAKDQSITQEDAYAYKMNDKERARFNRVMNETRCVDEMWIHYEVFRHYEWWHAYCDRNHIKLVNCTDGGILDSLPRQTLESVIHGKGDKDNR